MNKLNRFRKLMIMGLSMNAACSVQPPTDSASSLESAKDVYIGGCSPKLEGESTNTYYVCTATIWKNEEREFIEVDEISESIVESIAFKEEDVYASGTIAGYATSWKNGLIQFKDSSNYSRVQSMIVEGENVYLGGNYFNPNTNKYGPEIWKNGVRQNIPTNYAEGQINSMVYHDQVLYAGGNFHSGNRDLANIWIMQTDDSMTEVTLSNGSCDTNIKSMVMSGDTLYVLLRTCDSSQNDYERIITLDTKAADMQNSAQTQLEFSTNFGLMLNSLFVSAGNIFTAGAKNQFAHSWENDTENVLLEERSYANSIFVDGNDVYAAGGIQANFDIAAYWKNGTMTQLNDEAGYSMARVIKLK